MVFAKRSYCTATKHSLGVSKTCFLHGFLRTGVVSLAGKISPKSILTGEVKSTWRDVMVSACSSFLVLRASVPGQANCVLQMPVRLRPPREEEMSKEGVLEASAPASA